MLSSVLLTSIVADEKYTLSVIIILSKTVSLLFDYFQIFSLSLKFCSCTTIYLGFIFISLLRTEDSCLSPILKNH